MQLRALRPFRYASRALQPGDVFEAIDRDGKLLKRVGRAADHIAPEPEPALDAPVHPHKAEEPAKQEDAAIPAAPQPVGAMRYRRRDMTAEE